MSKLKIQVVNPAQEALNELGYSSVGHAIAEGWSSNEIYELAKESKKSDIDLAHEAWLKKKQEVIEGLQEAREDLIDLTGGESMAIVMVERAIDFIEKEVSQ